MALAHGLILGIGALLISIPIILHLLMQPKPRTLTFPALRFVQQMQQTNQRKLQLRHWILLLLRCLLIAALAAAFARPSAVSRAFGDWVMVGGGALLALLAGLLLLYAAVWSKPANIPISIVAAIILVLLLGFTGYSAKSALDQSSGHVLANQRAPIAMMIIVDNSPRMNYRHENKTLLQRAKDHGNWLIEQLPLGSSIAIVTNDGQRPFFSVDVAAARKRLDTLDVNYLSVPLPETIFDALEALDESPIERKEIYVLSDMTQQSWIDSSVNLTAELERYPNVGMFVFDVGVLEPKNVSVRSMKLSSENLPSRGTLDVEATLQSIGSDSDVVVRLMLEKPDKSKPVFRDGKTLVPTEHWTRIANADLADSLDQGVTLSLQEDLPTGIHHGWIEIEGGDSLPIDNRKYFTIEVQPKWKVLVVHPEGVDPGNLVDSINPQFNGDTDDSAYDCTVVDQRNFSQQKLGDYRAVFLLNPYPLTDPMWIILRDYVAAGGSLGIFLGHNAKETDLVDGSFKSDAAAEVLPGRLDRIWRIADRTMTIAMPELTHPALKEFRELASLGIWQPFPIFRFWEFEESNDPSIEVVARFSNGLPSVIDRRIGLGRVICMTTPITELPRPADNRQPWNDLFNNSVLDVWPAWLLVTEIANYLASGSRDQLNLLVGQTATMHNEMDQFPPEYRMFAPDDQDPTRVISDNNQLRYKFTNLPGNYRLKGEFDGPVLRGFSANLPNGATDLTRVPDGRLDDVFGKDRYQLARQRDQIQRQQGTQRVGQEFYPVLVLLMCIILGLELIMSNRFYRGTTTATSTA